MICSSPLTLKYKDYGTISVPCGNCINCRVSRSQKWADRIRSEILDGKKDFSFLTLTYDDDHVVFTDHGLQTLVPEHFTNFIKRLRSQIDYYEVGLKFKYFGCGEYGGQTGRPHYHILLIGLPATTLFRNIIHHSWQYGNIDYQAPDPGLDYSCINYVTGYITKKYTGKLGQDNYDDAIPPFQRSSLKLGYSYFEKNYDKVLDDRLKFRKHSVFSPKSFVNSHSDLKSKKYSYFVNTQLAPTKESAEKEYLDLHKAQQRAKELKSLSSLRTKI